MWCLVRGSRNSRQGSRQLILQRGTNLYFKDNYKIPRGYNIFQGRSNYFQGVGVQLLISIETYRTYDFPGGGGGLDPLPPPPLALRMASCRSIFAYCLRLQRHFIYKNMLWSMLFCKLTCTLRLLVSSAIHSANSLDQDQAWQRSGSKLFYTLMVFLK